MADQDRAPAPADDAASTPPAEAAAPAQPEETAPNAEPAPEAEKPAERPAQKVTVENVGPARKRLTIEVPAERIAAKIKDNYAKLKDDAIIPGFRRGRAPQRLLEKRFATSIRDDVRTQILSECYTQAIEDEKLEVLGEPDVKDLENLKLPEEGPLTFSLEVEVAPKVELPPLEGLELKKPKLAITDTTVDAEIARMRDRFGKLEPQTDAAAAPGDYLLSDIQILSGGNATPQPPAEAAAGTPGAAPGGAPANEIAHHPGGYVLVPGADRDFKGHVLGIVVNDLGQRLADKKVGDTVTVSMTGPSGHEDERIKDKPITVLIRIDRIERLQPAALESLAQQFGVTGVEALKQQVHQLIENRRDREQHNALQEQVIRYLEERVQMDLPEGVSRRQAARILHRQALEMAYRGVPEQEIEQRVAELRGGSEIEARQQLKRLFILDAAAKALDIEVSEHEVNGVIASLAMQRQRRPEKLRQEMQRNGQIEQVYTQVRDLKTMDAIIEKGKITEVDELADALPAGALTDTPAAKAPAADAPAADAPTAEAPKTEPAADAPVAEKPVAEKPVAAKQEKKEKKAKKEKKEKKE